MLNKLTLKQASEKLAKGEITSVQLTEACLNRIIEIDGKLDEEMIFEGNVVPLMDNEGNRVNAQVVTISDTHVTVDLNHPLAGENLHFKGSVLEVRDATEKEIASLTGGCGCGCDEKGCGDGNCGEGGCNDSACDCGEKTEKVSACGCGCN